jgi:acetyl-CoA acetyltransferase
MNQAFASLTIGLLFVAVFVYVLMEMYRADDERIGALLITGAGAAVESEMFGLGPIPAVRQALDRAGWDIGSVERFEINEAFVAIAIVVTRELALEVIGR